MQKTLIAVLIIFSLLLSGCERFCPSPAVERGTPHPLGEGMETPQTVVQPSPTLDSLVEKVLQDFPLRMGHSWIYQYLGYDQSMEVVWQVVERVIDTYYLEGYYIAELTRTVSLLEGQPPEDFLVSPTPGTFWYLVDGDHVYRFEELLHTDLEGAWLDLVIPFPQDNQAWFPHPDQRTLLEPSTVGFRVASDPFEKVLPMGGTYTCYNIATRFKDGTAEGTFCEGIGYVYQEFNYYNRVFGYRSELIDFSLQ